jgi:hypothetical protein
MTVYPTYPYSNSLHSGNTTITTTGNAIGNVIGTPIYGISNYTTAGTQYLTVPPVNYVAYDILEYPLRACFDQAMALREELLRELLWP